ncbi:class I SAM-dependent methyltransferase [Tenggerimyces flavus]|uniref:Class I SAM-dependent methyltransferase n=1 Tax=Tenggerimyces flavus TaxID=1708749 RepID=A0ABV7YB16_9ACTN|nr:class I SAM-dependent methyltransferase [Tenggerimyces flavus]MBM7785301.1 SAM-dependent methyltransferase [Tenggerimyces flavus]
MSENAPKSWLLDRPLTGFALPTGRWAKLMGWFMGRGNLAEQREVFDTVAIRTDERVLEVGYGPGILVEYFLRAGATVSGVDPSPDMREMATARARKVVHSADVDLRVGTAEATTFPDETFDAVVSVNNVPMWSSLEAGFAELHRVLRPGGRLVVAWHGGTQPTRLAKGLALPEDVLDRIVDAMRDVFGDGERQRLGQVEVFRATRTAGG